MRHKRKINTPNYYIKKRLLKNKPAIFGMVVIAIAHVIALLGYGIMPDQTPDANDGSATIKKLKPGSSVIMLRTIKNREIEQRFFLTKLFFGQESNYTVKPILSYRIDGWNVKYIPFKSSSEESTPMIEMVYSIYLGESKLLKNATGKNYQIRKNQIAYLDLEGNLKQISQASLAAQFEANNIDHRRYYLGTDKSGRDILSRLLFGTRISLGIGFVSVLISLLVGVTFGALAGFFGGFIDKFLMWLMTVVWSIPGIMLVIAISLALHSRGIWVAFVAVGLTMWVEVARVVRGQILSIREKLYVEAATALGIGNMRIIFKHILPNIMGPLIVVATANFASAILIEAGLSFLGMGVQPPMPSWGMMVNEGYNSNWESDGGYLVIIPSLCICLLVLAFNLFGNGLRDAYDPQSAIKW